MFFTKFAVLSLLVALSGLGAAAEKTVKALAGEFGSRFRVIETPHWWIVTDASAASAADTAKVLERTYDRFYKEWSQFGARPVKGRLVCISFANAEGLSSYREKIGVGAPDGRGFYSRITNRIVVCDEDKEPEGMVRHSRRRPGETRKHSRTAHEAAHQLAFNSGVQIPGRAYPAWFAEGLAGNYEPTGVDSPFGLTAGRRPDRIGAVAVLRRNDDLIPLREFVAMRHGARSKAAAQVLYPQAAALFRFLFTEYRSEFRIYQRNLAALRVHSCSEAMLLKAFEDAFGDVGELEIGWERYLNRLEGTVRSKGGLRRGAL